MLGQDRGRSSRQNSLLGSKAPLGPPRPPELERTSVHPQSQPNVGKTRNFSLKRELGSTPWGKQGLPASI